MNEPQPLDTGTAAGKAPADVSGNLAAHGSGDGLSNWAQDALLLMDDVDVLIRFASANAPMEQYTPAAASFWKVVHLLASERDRLAAAGDSSPALNSGAGSDT